MNEKIIGQLRKLAITKRLNFLIGSGVSFPAIPLMGHFSDTKEQTRNEQLIHKIKEVSEDLLFSSYEELKIKRNIMSTLNGYISFLESLVFILNESNSRQVPKNANIFTTNYDLFLETAIDYIHQKHRIIFNDGASGYFKRYLDSSNYNRTVSYKGLNDNYINEIPSITLIKPHGSINWKKQKNNILIKNKVCGNPVIVEPDGYEEATTFESNHFHEMLRIFQMELDKPQSVLFVIGFSFQDRHIAKMIKRATQNPELMIYVFGFIDSDRETYLENLNFKSESHNFRIFTPKSFDNYYRNKHTDENGNEWFSFTIKNLTRILGKIDTEDAMNEKT